MDDPADADPARRGQRFEACRDIDAVAKDVATVADDVAEVDADAELDPLLLRDLGVALGHSLLHVDRATHRIDDARKFDQQPVAGGLDDAAAMLFDLRVAQLAADRLQRGERAFLVRPHEPGIAHDIGGQDRSETSGYGHSQIASVFGGSEERGR